MRKKSEKEAVPKKKRKWWQRALIILAWVVGVLVMLVVLLFAWLTITEYKPKKVESVEVTGELRAGSEFEKGVKAGDELTVMTWNIGYGALGDNADFFMDGGKSVNTASRTRVQDNLTGIMAGIRFVNPDVVFLQEVDRNSKRSHGINEEKSLREDLNEVREDPYVSTFAYNYKVKFVPIPIPPIGKVNSGIETLSALRTDKAERIALPCPFKWPSRVGNLKRCFLVNRTPVLDEAGNPTGKELVLINLHLEAYDSGEGKEKQTKLLKEYLQTEVDKGNYVIAGGDFNQTFSNVDTSMYPQQENRWKCGYIDVSEFGSDLQFIADNHNPSCRSLDQKYEEADKETFQYYLIDGFIVSSNVEVKECSTLGMDFKNTDHNPVVLSVTLK